VVTKILSLINNGGGLAASDAISKLFSEIADGPGQGQPGHNTTWAHGKLSCGFG